MVAFFAYLSVGVPFGGLGVIFGCLVYEVPVVNTDISIKNWWKDKVIPPVS
jgi:hypothetical protein